MQRYLSTLEDEKNARSNEEYLGAFTESLKLIMHQNPVERMGNAVLLAAKTALRMKAASSHLREYEIASRLQAVARSIRLHTILSELTPEEKGMLKLNREKNRAPAASSGKRVLLLGSKRKPPSRSRSRA